MVKYLITLYLFIPMNDILRDLNDMIRTIYSSSIIVKRYDKAQPT